MTILNIPGLNGQVSSLGNFSEMEKNDIHPSTSRGSRIDLTSPYDSPLKRTLSRAKDNAVKTAYAISTKYPASILTSELYRLAGIHRSTTYVHVKELEELGVISKEIVEGTENNTNPTYRYKISEGIDRDELEAIFREKFPGDLLLGGPPEVEYNDLEEVDPFSSRISESEAKHKVSQTSEQQIQQVISMMAKEIVALKQRVASLEDRLNESSGQDTGVDLSDVLDLLTSSNDSAKN